MDEILDKWQKWYREDCNEWDDAAMDEFLATRHAGHLGANLRVAGALATERAWHSWSGVASTRPWAAQYLEMARDPDAWSGLAPDRAADTAHRRELVAMSLDREPASPQQVGDVAQDAGGVADAVEPAPPPAPPRSQ